MKVKEFIEELKHLNQEDELFFEELGHTINGNNQFFPLDHLVSYASNDNESTVRFKGDF